MKAILLYILLGLQLVGLIAMYAYYQAGLGYPTYLLRTVPVDPRDLIRGDYMILRYEISEVPARYENAELLAKEVNVSLKPDGEFWVIDEVWEGWVPEGKPTLRAKREGRELIYDLEKYFVPEGKGTPSGTVTVRISIRPGGSAQIKELYLDGKPYP